MDEIKYLQFLEKHDSQLAEAVQNMSNSISDIIIGKGSIENVLFDTGVVKESAKEADFDAPGEYREAHNVYRAAMENLFKAVNNTEDHLKSDGLTKLNEQFHFYIRKYNNLKIQSQEIIIKTIEKKNVHQ